MINYIILLISLILENGLSLLFYKTNSLFLPLFCLIALFIIYPNLKHKKNKYFVVSFIYGLIYDIVFTNQIGLTALIFLFISFIISKIYDNFQITLFNNIIITILIIIIYRFINYLYLIILLNVKFNIIVFLQSIYSSIVLNIVYSIIFYFIISKKIIKFMN